MGSLSRMAVPVALAALLLGTVVRPAGGASPPYLFAEGFAQASTQMPIQSPFNVFQPAGRIQQSVALGDGTSDTDGSAAATVEYGRIGGSVTADGAGGTQLASGDHELNVQINTCDPGCTFAQQGSWIDEGPAGGGFLFSGDPITGLMHVSVPIQFSAAMPFDVKLSVDAQALGGAAAFASASGQFSHTLAWGGFESVTNSHGAPVSDYTVTSDSGTDWSKPVPEPKPLAQCSPQQQHLHRSLRAGIGRSSRWWRRC